MKKLNKEQKPIADSSPGSVANAPVVRSPLLKEYLHYYIGSQVQYPDTDGKLTIATLTGVSRADGVETTYKRKKNGCVGDYLAWRENGSHDSNALNLKLILRSMHSVTQDEWNNAPKGSFHIWVEGCFYSPELFKYLLSLHVDLFGLIEKGLAINAASIR